MHRHMSNKVGTKQVYNKHNHPLQEELKRARDLLSSLAVQKKQAQQEVEETRKQVPFLSAKLEESQLQLKELSDTTLLEFIRLFEELTGNEFDIMKKTSKINLESLITKLLRNLCMLVERDHSATLLCCKNVFNENKVLNMNKVLNIVI